MTTREEREKAISQLEVLREAYRIYESMDISEQDEIIKCLDFAIVSLKTDLAYDLDYEDPNGQQGWIPIHERLPEVDEDGWSNYILISCSNYGLPTIGQYHQEKDGSGAFYDGDDERTMASYGLMVNAWMPLPKNYSISEVDND